MSAVPVEHESAVSHPPNPVVMKFGGTSVESAGAIQQLVELVKARLRSHPVVIVSALAGVTDELLEAGKFSAKGDLAQAREIAQQIKRRHEQVIVELFGPEPRRCLWDRLAPDFASLENLLSQIASATLFSPRLQDHLLGLGECLASKIVAAAFDQARLHGHWADARACIITDAAHTQATPLWEESDAQIRAAILPLIADGKVPVLGGFVGATRDGVPTTLGRGGSDFSASILGAALHATRIEIWTDVDGILSADPKLCPDAQRVASMSFEEAADLAYFGAKVLHPSTIAPAMRRNIPVCVLNSRNPEGPGTEIVARPQDSGCVVKAVTVRKGIAVVDVDAIRWLAPELLREIFEVFERRQHSLDLLSASRGSISLFVNSTEALPAIAEELRGLASVRWEAGKALVCLVGERVRCQPEIASQAFRALSDLDLRMICQGASERTISFLVDEDHADDAVRRLHRLFFASSLDSTEHNSAANPMCQAGGSWQ